LANLTTDPSIDNLVFNPDSYTYYNVPVALNKLAVRFKRPGPDALG